MQEHVEKHLLESYHFQTRPEKLTTEEYKVFNLLTLNKDQIWNIIVFLIHYFIRGRYVSHIIEEKFIVVHDLKRIQTGTVEYWLHVKYIVR